MKIIRLTDTEKLPASHEDPADPGVIKQILFRRDDVVPGRIQMINWSTLLIGKSFRLHYHEAMDEIFIILNGEAEITVGDESALLRKGDAVVIPQGAVHSMKNLTDGEVPYIALGIVSKDGGKTVNV